MRIGPDTPPLGEDPLDLGLFERHWFGETSPDEAARVEAWFGAHPERRAWYAQFGAGLATDETPELSGDERARRTVAILRATEGNVATRPLLVAEEAARRGDGVGTQRLRRILSRAGSSNRETVRMAGGATVKKLFGAWPRRDPGQRSLFRAVGFGVAAGAVFLLWGIGVAAALRGHHTAMVPAVEPSMRTYVTARGQRAKIQLPDGTRLTLAAASRIQIPETFGAGARDVFLEGEAVFDVVHDAMRPFRVHARRGVAEDLGTRFTMRAYAEDSLVTVAVEEGVVALGATHARPNIPVAAVAEGVILHRGQVGTLDAVGRVTTTAVPNIERYSVWSRGRLEFIQAPLPDVVHAIERWYDLEIWIDPRLRVGIVTAAFSLDSPLDVIHTLSLAVNARAEQRGRTVRLIGNAP